MAVVLASGTAAADSSDITVTAGVPVTVFLSAAASGPVPSDVQCDIKVKSAAGTYHTVGQLTGARPALVIDGPGVYRVSRVTASSAVVVEAV
jgi:hypothetical protein